MGSRLAREVLLSGFVTLPLLCGPLLFDNYTPWKTWALVMTAALALLAWGTQASAVLVPQTRRLELATFAALLASFALSVGVNPHGFWRPQVALLASFLALAWVAYQTTDDSRAPLARLILWNTLSAVPILLYAELQRRRIEPFPSLVHDEYAAATFGHPNMLGEYLGVTVIVQALALRANRHPARRALHGVLALAATALLVYLRNRASWLGLLAAGASVAILPRIPTRRFVRWALLVIGLAAALAVGVFTTRGLAKADAAPINLQTASPAEFKSLSQIIRAIRWRNTWALITERPWGLGPGNYEFGYLDYHAAVRPDPESNEGMIVRSPHNGFLAGAAEMGWLFELALLYGLALWFVRWWAARRAPQVSHDDRLLLDFCLACVAFTLGDALFAFPMENAFPYFTAAVAVGLSIRRLWTPKLPLTLPPLPRTALVGLALLLAYDGGAYFYSKYAEANHEGKTPTIRRGCRAYPANWRLCLDAALAEWNRGDSAATLRKLDALLVSFPNLAPAVKMRTLALIDEGRNSEACESLERYEGWYGPHSSVHETRAGLCDLPAD